MTITHSRTGTRVVCLVGLRQWRVLCGPKVWANCEFCYGFRYSAWWVRWETPCPGTTAVILEIDGPPNLCFLVGFCVVLVHCPNPYALVDMQIDRRPRRFRLFRSLGHVNEKAVKTAQNASQARCAMGFKGSCD